MFFLRVKNTPKYQLSAEAQDVWESRRFWFLCAGIVVCFVMTFARCVYRIAEMARGWRNRIMQDEVGFIVFESAMCAVAVAVLCIAHPGYCFKQMRGDTPKSTVEDTVLLEQKTEYNSSHSTA